MLLQPLETEDLLAKDVLAVPVRADGEALQDAA